MTRLLAALGLVLLLLPPAVRAGEAPLQRPSEWPQDYTGRNADPRVRFGKLPNGLRFAIMHNETPGDGVAMRLRIGSGSLEESEDEQGLAHFLEHMAFRGSRSVPDGEVVRMLERQGLSLGPDTNAATSATETVYKFNFPKSGDRVLDTGLGLYREIADRLTLSPQAIAAEKGVILSEERLRDTPAYRALKAELGAVLDGTRAADRWTIGKVGTIEAADHERLSKYYRLNYRPDNATIVIVGNVDPAAAERKIRALFSDWRAPPRPAQAPDGPAAPSARKTVAEFAGPGAPSQLTLSWVRPPDRRADTSEVEREELVDQIALELLNDRLAQRALAPASPFIGAQAHHSRSLFRSASLTQIAIIPVPDRWRDALDEVASQERSLLRDGVRSSELERAITLVRSEVQARAASDATRKSSQIADEIVATVDSDTVFASAAQHTDFILPLLETITPAEVDARLHDLFGTGGPLLFRSGTDNITDVELADALKAAYERSLGPELQNAAVSWPYGDFGAPSAILSRSTDSELGITTIAFANGSRLQVKPTAFEKDRVQIAVSLGAGRAGVSRDDAHKLWEVAVFPLGGTRELSFEQIRQWTQSAGKLVSVKLNAGARSFVLSGTSRREDMLAELQLLAAYARHPGFRGEAAAKAKSLAPLLNGHVSNSPTLVFARGAQSLLVGGDPRFEEIPSSGDLGNVGDDDLPSLLKQPFAGAADVAIVGDVSVDDAIAATRATFGSGAAAPRPRSPAPAVSVPASGQTRIFEHGGRADQAVYGEYFILPDCLADPKSGATARVAAALLKARLVDTAREKLGMTYSPDAVAVCSLELRNEDYFAAMVETPPANFGAFHALLADELRNLATRPVSADELERAKRPLVEAQRKARETNGFWLARMTDLAREPGTRNEISSEIQRLSSVTSADVQKLAATYLAATPPIVIVSRAHGADAAKTGDAPPH